MEKNTYTTWILLLIALITGGIVLNTSSSLEIVEKAITIQVNNAITQSILQQTIDKYPTASEQQLRSIAGEKIKEALSSQETKKLINELTEANKQFFKDKTGQTYLLEPDAYYYLRYAENILARGHPGETLKDGKPFDNLRRAPQGLESELSLLPKAEVYWFKLWHFISPQLTLLKAAFYLPVALGIISIALIFATALKIFKSAKTAFFSSTLFAVHPYFFRQNMAGFTDTPSLIMPLSLAFFLSILWIIEGKTWQRLIATAGALISLLALKYTWNGWFFTLAVIIAFCITFGCYSITSLKKRKFAVTGTIIAGAGIALWLYKQGYFQKALAKLQFVEKIPGLQETVRELARPTFDELIKAIGDTLFALILMTAIIMLFIKTARRNSNNLELFLFIWLIILSLPAIRILRFTFLVIPPATIIAGWLMEKARNWLAETTASLQISSKKFASIALLIILPAIVGATMIDTTNMPLPPMNSAIAETAEWIKQNTGTEAIINTWWDSGYIWQYAARRPTVLDAGPNLAAHWMAKALMTSNETYARNIFRMMDCSNKKSYSDYRQRFGIKSTSVLEKVLSQTKEEAEQTLSEYNSTDLINLTHCSPKEAYAIVDQNMLDVILTIDATANWNTELGMIREITINMTEDEAIKYIQETAQLSEEEARQKYYDAQSQTITPPDKTASSVKTCRTKNNTTLECMDYTFEIEDLNTTGKLHSIDLFEQGKHKEKILSEGKLALIVYKDELDTYRAILTSPEYRTSILVRMFAEDEFDNFKIAYKAHKPKRTITWKINWNTNQEDASASNQN